MKSEFNKLALSVTGRVCLALGMFGTLGAGGVGFYSVADGTLSAAGLAVGQIKNNEVPEMKDLHSLTTATDRFILMSAGVASALVLSPLGRIALKRRREMAP